MEREWTIEIAPSGSLVPHDGEEITVGKPFWVFGEPPVLLHRCSQLATGRSGATHTFSSSHPPWQCHRCGEGITYAEVWAARIARI
jgi:hypothetical protein